MGKLILLSSPRRLAMICLSCKYMLMILSLDQQIKSFVRSLEI
jgi:hypothetical protein